MDWETEREESELDRLRLLKTLYPLLDGLAIDGPLRERMIENPERAVRVCERVLNARNVRNPAALANSIWQRPDPTPRPRPEPEPEPEPAPPTLSAIEYAWSREESPMLDSLLDAMASSIAAAGGFSSIRETFSERELYDSDGNLIGREA